MTYHLGSTAPRSLAPRSLGQVIARTGAFILLGLAWSAARADEAGAMKYLEQAKKQVADKEQASTIQTTLQLAEAELAGVEAAKKDPIVAQIAAIRTQIAAADMAAFQANALRELDRDFETAQKLLGVRQSGIVKMLEDLSKKLGDSRVQTALGTQKLIEYQRRLGTLQTVNRTKLAESAVEEMKRQVESVEGEFANTMKELKEGSPLGKKNAAESFERRYQSFIELSKEAPRDDAAAIGLVDKMNAMQKQVATAFGMAEAVEVHDRLKRDWDSYASGWQGWEAEATRPSFADLVSNHSQANSRLGAPKTVELYNQARRFLERHSQNEQAKPYLAQPPVKDLMDTVTKLRDDSMIRLINFAGGILGDAENTRLDQNGRNRLESLVRDDLRIAMEGVPQLQSFQDRGRNAIARFDSMVQAGVQAQTQARQQSTGNAAGRWADLIKGLSTTNKFDPAKPDDSKGKLIRLQMGNRSGFLDNGAFDFANEIDGKPFVGKFSQAVKQAIADVTATTGSGLPEETPYDIIAVYEGDQGVMQRRNDLQVRTDSGATVQGEYREGVNVPILNIVGLYCGPVAALGPIPAGDGSGTIQTVASVDVHEGGGFMFRLVDLILMLLAATCVLVKAQFAPLAAAPALGAVRENLTDRNQMIIGFLFLVLAVYRIIGGYVIYGLIGNVALGAAGVYLALGFFQGQSWFKPQWAEQLRKFAVPIGITCAVIGILRLFMGAMLLAV
jgi:hypothetical protein